MDDMYIDDLKIALIGKKIEKIFFNEENLKFQTNAGNVVLGVDGDCCSTSRFHDFFGVKNLIGHTITDVKEVPLTQDDKKDKREEYDDSVQCYGYQMTTESEKFGEVTSVFSFRNYSNGYYGGSLTSDSSEKVVLPEITDDVVEAAEQKPQE